MTEWLTRQSRTAALIVAMAMVIVACGDAPLGSVGERSSGWINEPEVTTTTQPPVTVPDHISSERLLWVNDEIVAGDLSDPAVVVNQVFARREGDRFIQASRAEIAAVLPQIEFPAEVPYGAEWVSSQLVIDNSGQLAANPTVAFGIWSAEPYTRSRSVAQMAVLRVSVDPETAGEIAANDSDTSCARFADVTTTGCDILDRGDKLVWALSSSGGTTLIWFDAEYRYELFARSFVPREAVLPMIDETIPLSELGAAA